MISLLLYAAVLILALICLDNLMKNKEYEKIPGPKGLILLRNTLEVLLDPVKLFYYFRGLSIKYNRLFKLTIGHVKAVIIYHPEDVEVLISGNKNNTKGFVYTFIEPWLKEGLLTSKGSTWQHRRKMLQPGFHFNILINFKSTIEENCRKLVEQLQSETCKPKTDITPYVDDFTLNCICETAMGTKLDEEITNFGKVYKEGIYKLGQYAVYRAQRPWLYPDFIFKFTDIGRKQSEILNILKSFRDKVIDKRRVYKNELADSTDASYVDDNNNLCTSLSGKKKMAMLDLLLEAEKASIIDAKGIGEEVDTFMFGGHDTSANAIQFTLMLFANNQEAQDRAVEECSEIVGDSDRSLTLADLANMKYLECCIKECLRLYPPLPVITRKVSQPLKLKEYEVPAGAECAVSIFDLHRRSDQFEEPLQFRPERFLAEKPTWHPYAYIPFSAGPRNCIGQKFAMIELKMALAAILLRYRILPITAPQDLVFVTDYVLRIKNPIHVKFEERQPI
ncbi:cytochrome P450 4C1-like [Epargyreus clarus]|uniref:cytochrome P450 4C1-like n=1 Tax=Epargyreus clarus TaxID=520877 RepID=UPI003C2C8061